MTYSQTYKASCAAGYTPQWGVLGWNVKLPSDSSGSASVLFEVHTAPIAADGSIGAYGALVTAGAAATAPGDEVCSISGPMPCPKDLYAALGAANAKKGLLELEVTLKPSPAANVAPTLNSWNVTYSCVPSE
jgi:hypothetical protein